MTEPRWLSPYEQQIWRNWLRLSSSLPAALHRELNADTGLSLPDFEVLVQLTDDHTRRMRVSDLADAMQWDRSRLSHHLTRMERRGLINRAVCIEDRRGAWIELTDDGRQAIEQAAPAHVETVRQLVFDQLTTEETTAFGHTIDKLLAALDTAHHTE